MTKTTFNNLIELEYNESFKQLSDEENNQYFTGNLLRLSFHNKDKHILLSLAKSKNSFFNLFVSVAAALVDASNNLENTLKNYERLDEYESKIFNQDSITECFSYDASNMNVKQYGELTVFKIKNSFYTVYCLSRFEDNKEAKKIFKQFKDSFKPLS